MNSFETHLSLYKKVLSIYSVHIQEIISKAEILFKKKQYNRTLALLCDDFLLSKLTHRELAHCYLIMGRCYLKLYRYTESVIYLKKAISENSRLDLAYFYLGTAYRELKKYDKAISSFKKANNLNSEDVDYYLSLAAVYRYNHENDKAQKVYRRLLKFKPTFAMVYRNLVQCLHYDNVGNDDLKNIDSILHSHQTVPQEKMQCHFALGKIYHDLKKYDAAFKHFQDANRIRNKRFPYNLNEYQERIQQCIDFFNPKLFFESPRGSRAHQPVFIIGLPRSGKTLIQNLLQADKSIFGVDEYGVIDMMVYRLKRKSGIHSFFPDIKPFLTEKNLSNIAQYYLESVEDCSSETFSRVVDTTPCNFRYLGYIALIFPNAKIIHVKRDPMDHCLQIFMKYFAEGNDYAFSLNNIVHYYRQYQKLMSHWKKVLPLDICEVSYESLLSDPSLVMSSLFEHIDRPVSDEIRQAILSFDFDKSELFLWKHYEKYLERLKVAFSESKKDYVE